MAVKSTKTVLNGERSYYEGALVLTNGITINVKLPDEVEIEYDENNIPSSFSGSRIEVSFIDNVSGLMLNAGDPVVHTDGSLSVTLGYNGGL